MAVTLVQKRATQQSENTNKATLTLSRARSCSLACSLSEETAHASIRALRSSFSTLARARKQRIPAQIAPILPRKLPTPFSRQTAPPAPSPRRRCRPSEEPRPCPPRRCGRWQRRLQEWGTHPQHAALRRKVKQTRDTSTLLLKLLLKTNAVANKLFSAAVTLENRRGASSLRLPFNNRKDKRLNRNDYCKAGTNRGQRRPLSKSGGKTTSSDHL
eukprot:6176503-Pleurochrysis_carterae.AAC.2